VLSDETSMMSSNSKLIESALSIVHVLLDIFFLITSFEAIVTTLSLLQTKRKYQIQKSENQIELM